MARKQVLCTENAFLDPWAIYMHKLTARKFALPRGSFMEEFVHF